MRLGEARGGQVKQVGARGDQAKLGEARRGQGRLGKAWGGQVRPGRPGDVYSYNFVNQSIISLFLVFGL